MLILLIHSKPKDGYHSFFIFLKPHLKFYEWVFFDLLSNARSPVMAVGCGWRGDLPRAGSGPAGGPGGEAGAEAETGEAGGGEAGGGEGQKRLYDYGPKSPQSLVDPAHATQRWTGEKGEGEGEKQPQEEEERKRGRQETKRAAGGGCHSTTVSQTTLIFFRLWYIKL